MEGLYIKNEIESKYLLKIESIEKNKNSYKIKTNEGIYGVKVIKYQYPHFYFILSTIQHLKNRGFRKTPQIIKTKDKVDYIKIGNKLINKFNTN